MFPIVSKAEQTNLTLFVQKGYQKVKKVGNDDSCLQVLDNQKCDLAFFKF